MSKKKNRKKIDWSKKFDYFYRWVFGAIYANSRICNGHIEDTKYTIKGLGQLNVGENDVGECNMASLILTCCAIELYGRILMGYTHDVDKVSKESFIAFVKTYFPQKYSSLSEQIYIRYRCGLVHSYITGAKVSGGIFPTRNGRDHEKEHLKFVDNNRLVLNMDLFVGDLKTSFEKYFKELKNNKTKSVHLVTMKKINLQKSALKVLNGF